MKRAALITDGLGGEAEQQIFDALKKHTDVQMLDINKMRIAAFPGKWEVFYPKMKLSGFDSAYVRGCLKPARMLDFRLTLSEHMEKMGIDVINSSTATRICRNKFSAIQVLQRHGVPTPKTRLALTPDAAMKSIKKMKKPVIIKLLTSSYGKGVIKISSNDEAESVIDALWTLGESLYFQEYIETKGTDIRAFVVGGEVVAAMERKAKAGDFRSNISSGGKGRKVELDARLERMALRSAKVVGAEIAGVDIVLDGRPKVLEVNVNPGLHIMEVTGIDVAEKIAEYIAGKGS